MKRIVLALMLVLQCGSAIADQTVVVTAERLNVRASPSTNAPILGQLGGGERLTVVPISDSWARIVEETGTNGFVSRRYLRLPGEQNSTSGHQSETASDIFAFFFVIFLLTLPVLIFVRACQWMSRKGHPVLGFLVNLFLAGSVFGWFLLIAMAIIESRNQSADTQNAQSQKQLT